MKCRHVLISESLYRKIKDKQQKMTAKEKRKKSGRKRKKITLAMASWELGKGIKQ